MEYKVIISNNSKKLVEMVNQALKEGWKLQGGVSASSENTQYLSETYYAQAMVRG